MVERYLPNLTHEGVREQVRREKQVVGLRHVRTTYLRDDELCFSLFEGPSLAAVQHANDSTGMAYVRITEAFDVAEEEGA
jgi:hypothetical protein